LAISATISIMKPLRCRRRCEAAKDLKRLGFRRGVNKRSDLLAKPIASEHQPIRDQTDRVSDAASECILPDLFGPRADYRRADLVGMICSYTADTHR
jgi:hypothetical protein